MRVSPVDLSARKASSIRCTCGLAGRGNRKEDEDMDSILVL